jgi:hypothetical protein
MDCPQNTDLCRRSQGISLACVYLFYRPSILFLEFLTYVFLFLTLGKRDIRRVILCPFFWHVMSQKSLIHSLWLRKLQWSRYRPGVAQRVGRGIALLFNECGTRRRWLVSSTPRPRFTPGKHPVRILQEAGWAPGPVWKGGKSRPPLGFDPGPSSP